MTRPTEAGKHSGDGECGGRRSIPTIYKKIRFRSKLEADWARAFDEHGVEWAYEESARYYGDVFYLPDFWLPRSRQFVEVKAVFEPDDCRKIWALCTHVGARLFTDPDTCPDITIVACWPKGDFVGWQRTPKTAEWSTFLTKYATTVSLFACGACGGRWFADASASWRCQCCGIDNGNATILDQRDAPLPWPPRPGSDSSHDVAAD
jgi:hypothetical protein